MHYYLAVDIGTTSVKVIAFSAEGELLFRYATEYPMLHPQAEWSEQDPDEILKAVIYSMQEVINTMLPLKPLFISFSAVMHSLIAIDKSGKPLTNSLIWADNRAKDIAEKLKGSKEGIRFYENSGVPVHAMTPLCKLIWLKIFEPAVFLKAHKFIGIKEYIFFKLFGTYAVDTSIASATGMLNIHTLNWDPELLAYLGMKESQFAELVPVKKIFSYRRSVSFLLDIPDNTPFIIGGSDGALANIAEDMIADRSLVITVGTSAAVRILRTESWTSGEMSTFCYHAIDDQYIIGAAGNNGGIVFQWLKDKLLNTKDTYEALLTEAASIDSGSEGLLFLPYILGERAPIWNADAKGCFFGLTINHTRAHLIRSVIEGITLNLFDMASPLINHFAVSKITASGGLARDPLWLQILADVFNIPVCVSSTVESSALGAVIVGMEAMNIPAFKKTAAAVNYKPHPEKHSIYLACFKKFKALYNFQRENPVSGAAS